MLHPSHEIFPLGATSASTPIFVQRLTSVTRTMKPHVLPAARLARTTVLVAAAALATTVLAQVASAPAIAPNSGKSSTDAIVLSPFEVSTERDTGFVAASALSGGRLASDLRDTPVSYSVITRDFIDALNLTDLQAAADW